MEYKLVFSDIDGTLLDSHHQISQGSQETVQKLQRKGIPFILVSARMPGGILPLQQNLGINGPMVCFSGALVFGAAETDGTREVLYNQTMEPEDVTEVYRRVIKHFPIVSFSAYNKDHWFVPSTDDEWITQEHVITGIPPQIYDFNEEFPPVNKILCMGQPQAIASLEMELKKHHTRMTMYQSKPTYLEIMAQNVKKSFAIDSLIRRYNVTKQEIIAIGDNYNDMDMLRFAGLGIAMGNSPDEVKAAADIVTLSNDQDGLKVALEKYCLDNTASA